MRLCFSLALFAIMASGATVYANGLAVDEQDPVSLSTVLAGRAALADDPNTVFYNPAGMTRLEGRLATGSVIYIRPSGRFSNQSSTLNGAPLTGGNGGDAGVGVPVPSLYLVMPVGERWKVGFAANAPFGLSSKYDEGWVGRYHSLESTMKTVNLNPAIAHRLTDRLSLGVGLNAQYVDVELINAIDMGSLLGFPQSVDGRSTLDGSDWSLGYNLGLLFEASPQMRVGLAYRSRVHHEVDGGVNFVVPTAAAPLTAAGLFRDTGAHAELSLPETLSLSIYYDLNPRWALLGDVTYTAWSRFRSLFVAFDNPLQPPLSETQAWHDTYRTSVGIVHRPSDEWKLRFGVAVDPSPASNQFQRPRLVLGDRILVGAGLSYRPTKNIELDVAYMHSFSDDVRVNLNQPATSGTLDGTFKLDADLFSFRALLRF